MSRCNKVRHFISSGAETLGLHLKKDRAQR